TPTAAAVGDASYALYLTHMPITHLAGNVARLLPISFPNSPVAVICFFIATAAVAVLLALLLFRYVESPALQLTKRLTTRSASSPPAIGREPFVDAPARENAQA